MLHSDPFFEAEIEICFSNSKNVRSDKKTCFCFHKMILFTPMSLNREMIKFQEIEIRVFMRSKLFEKLFMKLKLAFFKIVPMIEKALGVWVR